MTIKTAIGLMSGTSMDGIDVALVKTDGRSEVGRGASRFYPYEPGLRNLLKTALEDAGQINKRDDRPGVLGKVEQQITDLHAKAVNGFLKDNDLNPQSVDVIGFHGQTVLHRPEAALTVQLGDGRKLASGTGIPVVHDMRANDVANGGQGAPLVPVYHRALAKNIADAYRGKTPLAFVNIGGISNISFIGADLIAFDTGPGNALIDQWVQAHAGIPYDQGGMIAAEGGIDRHMVDGYMANPFFSKRIPKSLDRNDFRPPDAHQAGVEDGARTLAHVTARSIMRSVVHLPEQPKLWIICGGGRLNSHIMHDLSELASTHPSTVITAESAGFDGDSMEAEAWAYLAVRSLEGLPLTFPKTTGASTECRGGVLSKPR